MFQPKGWEGAGACPGPRHQPHRILTEPPSAAAPCRSTPRPGILCQPCQDGSRYGKRRARPLRAGRAAAHAPSPLKNARFRGQHPLHKPQPERPGVNHGRDGARLARSDVAPLLQALKTMERLRTCFSDPGRFLGPTNYSQHTHHSQIVICNHFWQHHEQEHRARATAVIHVGPVILPLHLSQACPGWAGGVTAPGLSCGCWLHSAARAGSL